MKYNPKIHNRKSIRLKGYDYSQAGLYFVTICCQNRTHFYGRIENNIMQLNDAGKMIEKWYAELENKFPDIKCQQMVVMPNHFHCIIENVGADLRVRPNTVKTDLSIPPDTKRADPNTSRADPNTVRVDPNTVRADLRVRPNTNNDDDNNKISNEPILGGISNKPILGRISGEPILGEHIGSPLRRVVQWFKTMTTNEYIRNVKSNDWKRFDRKLWQRNYWEHIIRNEKSYYRISEYIKSNPQRWKDDMLK
jgi:putative transposase